MTVNKYEAVGISISIGAMALVLWLLQLEEATKALTFHKSTDNNEASIIVGNGENQDAALADAIIEGSSEGGKIEKLIIDDVIFGTGKEVAEGDVVTVHYIGSLKNGQQFDNSYSNGEPFTFTVGEGRVITGWEKGIIGMKAGGQRVLVIPSEFGYGKKGAGPIPANATLVFAIELLSIE